MRINHMTNLIINIAQIYTVNHERMESMSHNNNNNNLWQYFRY